MKLAFLIATFTVAFMLFKAHTSVHLNPQLVVFYPWLFLAAAFLVSGVSLYAIVYKTIKLLPFAFVLMLSSCSSTQLKAWTNSLINISERRGYLPEADAADLRAATASK